MLYDFTGNDKNTTVQKVENMVKEKWFLDAIKEEPDFFLLAGCVPSAQASCHLLLCVIIATCPCKGTTVSSLGSILLHVAYGIRRAARVQRRPRGAPHDAHPHPRWPHAHP